MRLPRLLSVWASGLLSVLCLIPLFLSHPDFYRQFLQLTQSVVLSSSAWDRLAVGFSLAWQVAPHRLFILFATVPVLCLGMVTFWRAGRVEETLALFVAPLVGFGLLMFVRPAHTYPWFLEPWFLLVALVVTALLVATMALAAGGDRVAGCLASGCQHLACEGLHRPYCTASGAEAGTQCAETPRLDPDGSGGVDFRGLVGAGK